MLASRSHAPLATLLFELGPPCDYFQCSTEGLCLISHGFRQGSCNQVHCEWLILASGQNTNETLMLDSSGAPFPCLSSPLVPVRQGGYCLDSQMKSNWKGSTLQDPIQVRVRHNCFQPSPFLKGGGGGVIWSEM